MKSNSFAHSMSNGQGNSAYNGGVSPASRTITGERLGAREYGSYPELA